MSSEIEVSTASVEDAALVLQVCKTTFLQTWEHLNSPEDMALYLAEKFTPEQIFLDLKDPDNLFFLARKDGKIAGYAKLRTSKVPTELQGSRCIEIERMYVLKEFQAMGVGNKLMDCCLEFGIKQGYEIVWLGVWKDNPAVQFYSRWGFEWFGFHTFILGNDHQRDELMKKVLR